MTKYDDFNEAKELMGQMVSRLLLASCENEQPQDANTLENLLEDARELQSKMECTTLR